LSFAAQDIIKYKNHK